MPCASAAECGTRLDHGLRMRSLLAREVDGGAGQKDGALAPEVPGACSPPGARGLACKRAIASGPGDMPWGNTTRTPGPKPRGPVQATSFFGGRDADPGSRPGHRPQAGGQPGGYLPRQICGVGFGSREHDPDTDRRPEGKPEGIADADMRSWLRFSREKLSCQPLDCLHCPKLD